MPASKVRIEVGFVSIPARLEKATDGDESGLRTVCLGKDTPHGPARVNNYVQCPVCERKETSTFGYADRAAEVGDTLRVITKEEIAAASGVPIKTMALKFHNREKFFAATVAGDSVQNLHPDKGGEKAYTALVRALSVRPELVAVTIYAPRSKNALWVLEVHENRLVASKRCWPEDVRTVAAVTPAEVSDTEVEMLGQFVDATISDFDLGEYVNQRRVGVQALVDNAAGTSAEAVSTPTSNTAGDLLSALQASLDAAKPSKPRRAVTVREVRGEKAPAKKATPRKRAAAKKTTATRRKENAA